MRISLINLARELLLPFFLALGVVLGGSLIGALAVLFTAGSPLASMRQLAENVRLWAIVVAIGGSFHTIRMIESGIFGRQITSLLRQSSAILMGLLGATFGHRLIIWLTGGD